MLFYRYIFYCIYHMIARYFFKFFDKFFLGRAARCIAAPRLGKNVSYGGGQMVGEYLVFTLRYLLAFLCKGSWREATEGLSAAMLDTDSPKNGVYLGLCCAIPPVRCEPNRLPLHPQGD